jgi:hypothetical protein
MLFQVVHTHTNETCPGRSSEEAKQAYKGLGVGIS